MRYYEISPNIEIVSNQSNTFYFSPMISMSNLLDIEYKNSKNFIYNHFNIKNFHQALDYMCISDEECINLRFLFAEPPNNNNNNNNDNNIVQFIRSEGIFPNDNIDCNKNIFSNVISSDDILITSEEGNTNA